MISRAGGEATLEDSGGYFVAPTLFSTTSDELRIAREEIFGPVLVASPYESLEEVARRANDTDYGLAAAVDDPEFAPEPYTDMYQRTQYQSLRSQARQGFSLLRKRLPNRINFVWRDRRPSRAR